MAHQDAGTLFLQCGAEEADRAAAIASGPGSGVIVTHQRIPGVNRLFSQVVQRLAHARRDGAGGALLADANKYSGNARKSAREGLDPQWASWLRGLGLPVLTDSGYIGEGDEAGLRCVLDASRRMDDAIAHLPLHASWLKKPAHLDVLTERILAHEGQVAISLEAADDPLGSKGAVVGLLSILESGVRPMLLRSDVSAIGALAFGARAGAVGSRSSLRHIFPAGKKGGGPAVRHASAMVSEALSYRRVTTIAEAYRATPESSLWDCHCDTCRGRPLAWLATLKDENRQLAAFAHSAEALVGIHERLMHGYEAAPQASQRSWFAKCEDAIERGFEIEVDYPQWKTPRFVEAWRSAMIATVPALATS